MEACYNTAENRNGLCKIHAPQIPSAGAKISAPVIISTVCMTAPPEKPNLIMRVDFIRFGAGQNEVSVIASLVIF